MYSGTVISSSAVYSKQCFINCQNDPACVAYRYESLNCTLLAEPLTGSAPTNSFYFKPNTAVLGGTCNASCSLFSQRLAIA